MSALLIQALFSLLALLVATGISVDLSGRNVLDLIQSLNTSQISKGFRFITGFNNNTPAIRLDDSSRFIKLPEPALMKALRFLRHDEVTFLATIRQEIGDSGSIIAFSAGLIRFLEIESSGRRNELRFHYTHDQQIRVETFPYKLTDNKWHRIALSLSGDHLTLFVDCVKIYERVISSVDRDFQAESTSLSLFLGQRNTQHALFRGALQDVKIVTQSHGYLLQCPSQNTNCPTCAQYQELEKNVTRLDNMYYNLSLRLLRAEERLKDQENCECHKSCFENGTSWSEGNEWTTDHCTQCICRNGTVSCQDLDCPPTQCKHPVYRDGECCPVCLMNCYYHKKYYDHGEGFNPRVCVTCSCNDGRMACERTDPDTSCPALNCSEEDRIAIQDVCCPVCKGTDFCSHGHDCHANATCTSLATRYACQCAPGFHGDGRHCEDLDECLEEGGHNGHHCHGNTVCVNTIGSYTCECSTGHTRVDAYTCEEIDECLRDEHQCHKLATCVNTPGSYVCHCPPGYRGDGNTCNAVCRHGCQNGGTCVAPDLCLCRHGYMGLYCELDVDECELGIATCQGHSKCVNMPGWYRCDCDAGFHSNWLDSHYGRLCLDKNECVGEGDGHTCHSTLTCMNAEGSYYCQCEPGRQCTYSCAYEGIEHRNGTHWVSELDHCMDCTCMEGVSKCEHRSCDCNSPDIDYTCCPNCDVTGQCKHQEYPVFMQNGEQWMFQCQTCECLNGEIDCWPLECPHQSCDSYVQLPGDCCPRCLHDNPCMVEPEIGGVDHSALTCIYKDHHYSHAERWGLEGDPCTLCECKAGHICCSFNETCTAWI